MIAERISGALRRRRPETNLKGWIGRIADKCQVSDRAVEGWMYGDGLPSLANYFALIDFLGDDFHAEVREGEPPPIAPADRIEIIRAELRELERALSHPLKVVS